MKRAALIALTFLAGAAAAYGQSSPTLPYAYPAQVGTTAVQVLPNNPLRKNVFFQNPNATATVAVCPAVSRKDGTNIACTVNGAGSITLFPGDSIGFAGIGGNPSLPSAWNAIASAPGSALTALEFE